MKNILLSYTINIRFINDKTLTIYDAIEADLLALNQAIIDGKHGIKLFGKCINISNITYVDWVEYKNEII